MLEKFDRILAGYKHIDKGKTENKLGIFAENMQFIALPFQRKPNGYTDVWNDAARKQSV